MIINEKYIFKWYTGIGTNSLYLSRNNGSTWELLTQIEGSDNPETILEYEWTITGPTSDNCRVKVVDSEDNEEILGEVFEITNIFGFYMNTTVSIGVGNF